jgi:hypothetical protein
MGRARHQTLGLEVVQRLAQRDAGDPELGGHGVLPQGRAGRVAAGQYPRAQRIGHPFGDGAG